MLYILYKFCSIRCPIVFQHFSQGLECDWVSIKIQSASHFTNFTLRVSQAVSPARRERKAILCSTAKSKAFTLSSLDWPFSICSSRATGAPLSPADFGTCSDQQQASSEVSLGVAYWVSSNAKRDILAWFSSFEFQPDRQIKTHWANQSADLTWN